MAKIGALFESSPSTVVDLRDEAQIAALISRIEGEMIALDPEGMEHPEHYWVSAALTPSLREPD